MAMLYEDYIALRDGKMTEERAKELGLVNFEQGRCTSPVGSLHDAQIGGHRDMGIIPYGANNTYDNW